MGGTFQILIGDLADIASHTHQQQPFVLPHVTPFVLPPSVLPHVTPFVPPLAEPANFFGTDMSDALEALQPLRQLAAA